jgi:hypothetical protein
MAELQWGDRQSIRAAICWPRIPQPPSCVDLQAGGHRLLDALVLKGYGWKASEEIL